MDKQKEAKTIGFYAMLHRMRYINRWGLMRNQRFENLQEHSLDVAILAHALAIIRRQYFSQGRTCPDPTAVAVWAIYHDVGEIITGDMPTPIKYFNKQIRDDYRAIEEYAARRLLSFLPEELAVEYEPFLLSEPADEEEQVIVALVKAADSLAAYIKCLDELNSGNHDFIQAEKTISAKLAAYHLPELDYFMEKALPAYRQTLDELHAYRELDDQD